MKKTVWKCDVCGKTALHWWLPGEWVQFDCAAGNGVFYPETRRACGECAALTAVRYREFLEVFVEKETALHGVVADCVAGASCNT